MEPGLYNHNSELVPFSTEKRNTLAISIDQTKLTDLLTRLALDDIYNGSPVVFVDPTGEATDYILERIPKNRQADVILFDPARSPFAFNLLANIPPEKRDIFASTLLETVKGLWGYENAPTPVLDKYFRGSVHTAIQVYGTTLYSLKFILTDKTYRTELLSQIKDTVTDIFWKQYETLTDKEQRQDVDSLDNKLWAFLFSPLLRNCLDQRHNNLVFENKIVLVSLRTRELGTENASLLGALVLASLYIEDTPTNLYINGSRFGTAILGKLLTSCPLVNVTLAVQYLDQIAEQFQPVLLGGIGQIIAFRTSLKDSETLAPSFNLNNGFYKLSEMDGFGYGTSYISIDGTTTRLSPIDRQYPRSHQEDKIRRRCASQYTAPLSAIANRIDRFNTTPKKRKK